ncbi:hypothetical protein [Streptomyces sp. NPDC058045]|uniref:hypothetical protein n=1 Tax=Streptomyces sp. NPDC058045 TaxID=3346311 RepID=UPI0036EE720D
MSDGVYGGGYGAGPGGGGGWSEEHRFEAVIAEPAVRQAIAGHTARSQSRLSAEEFLSLAASLTPLVGHSLPSSAAQGRRLATKLGVRSGKSREVAVQLPVGRAIASVLCSLALHGQPVRGVEQYGDGCVLIAEIPSDARTFGGVLRVAVRRGAGGASAVHAAAEIPGQLLDWGRSKGALDALFTDLAGLGLV